MLSSSQLEALAIVVKPFALLSMMGSALIVREVMTDELKRKLTYHRILLGVSCVDFCASFWFFMSHWAVPKGTDGIPQAAGNEGTCKAQAWFISLNIASPLYNVSLCVYYLLMIKCEWTQEKIKSVASPFLLFMPILFGLGGAFAGLGMDIFAPAGMWCWIAPHPSGCSGSDCAGQSGLSNIFRFVFFYGPLWLSIISVGVMMTIVYANIIRGGGGEDLDRHNNVLWLFQRDHQGQEISKEDRARRLARQAIWYMVAFLLTWTWPTAVRLTQITRSPPFGLFVMMAIFAPLQGLLNFISYIRPRFLRNKAKHPEWNLYQLVFNADEEDFRLGAEEMRSGVRRRSSVFSGLLFFSRRLSSPKQTQETTDEDNFVENPKEKDDKVQNEEGDIEMS
ncbi:hypothetical protein ACHAWF_007950 [Thalassiosira exigua]